MVKKAEKSHKALIADLWCEAFGDKKEDVLSYLDFLLSYFYIFVENDVVCAMAAVLPLALNGKRGGYIYAVATKESMRNRGISTQILNYIKTLPEYDFYVLVPQSKSLFDFYKRFDFAPVSCIERKSVSVASNNDASFACERISAKEYADFRKAFLGDKLIEWNPEVLEFAKGVYSGDFYAIMQNGRKIGACFCYTNSETVTIKELIAKDGEVLGEKIAVYFGAKSALVTYAKPDASPAAMIYPAISDELYFAIALD